jgi:glycosyltransferase involved in cell wall biosynthesis
MTPSSRATMLIISRYFAFAKTPYAGSFTHRYYLKCLNRDFDVKLVTVADPSDAPGDALKNCGISAEILFVDEHPRRIVFFLLFNWRNIFNYFGKTLGIVNGYVQRVILRRLKTLREQGYRPDYILLEWTQTLLMIGKIKKLFPDAKFIASEHDVSFIRFQRSFAAAHGAGRIKEGLRYRSVKKTEISSLRQADLVVPHNAKDAERLIDQGLPSEAIRPIAPYFTDYGDVRYNPRGSAILFFGAMDRPENYLSIAWFIERVFQPHLLEAYSLSIVGMKPHSSLEKYRSEKIAIPGFVPDIRPYLSGSVCMVAPLVSGAGIKVKVIEAMSAGLPVMANDIAIEGIPAVDGVHYLHAQKPEDYLRHFDSIREGRIDLSALSKHAKELIAETFDLDKSYDAYKKAIDAMIGNVRQRGKQ